MNLVTQIFAIVAVLFGLVAYVLESFLFHRADVQTFLLGKPEPAEGVRPAGWLLSHCSARLRDALASHASWTISCSSASAATTGATRPTCSSSGGREGLPAQIP